jgi:hypothetical protein
MVRLVPACMGVDVDLCIGEGMAEEEGILMRVAAGLAA